MKTPAALLLVTVLVPLPLAAAALAPPPPRATAPARAAATQARVYYFHGTARCKTCRTIEAYARETLTTAFAAELQARKLEWLVINVDEPANRHFVDDFQLYARSVVVVDVKNPKRFKVLERVWELVGSKPEFQKYVEQEIRGFGRS